MHNLKQTSKLLGLALGLSTLGLGLNTPFAQSAGKVDVRLIDKGEGKPKTVKAVGYINVPIAKVWKALTNYGNYQNFMPRVASSHLDSRSGNLAQATHKLDVPWPFSGTWYTNRYVENAANHSIRWSMVKGSIKHNEGSWQLKSQGKGTYGTYTVTADVGVPVIPQWMYGELTKSTIPDIFHSLESHAAKL
ncbi:MAG: SRPBCC family protein [Candidatus Sericytochromatia bacterium]|nr:SRPBCC family protein [Candidatus Sericytochromatia bacterium]